MQGDRDIQDRMRQAALLGLGMTGGLGAYDSLAHTIRDRIQRGAVPATRSFSDFQGKLQPGDVVFHRRPSKHSGAASIGSRELPFKESDVMIGAKGDPFYHPSVYRGGGNITEAAGAYEGVKNTRLNPKYPEELMAYRLKDPKRGEISKAQRFLDRMIGSDYKSHADTIKHGATHLFTPKGPRTSGLKCKIGKKGIVCSELVAEAYPRVFKDRFMSPIDMRHSKDMELVARYGTQVRPITAREAILSKGVYPLLKNLKWGALAGGVGLAGMSLADQFRRSADA